nr:proline dehydrogenase family protein [Rhizohabitans arisaemae]
MLQELSRCTWMARTLRTAPGVRGVIGRYVAGEHVEDAVGAARRLRAAGLLITLDYLGEDVRQPSEALRTVACYQDLLVRLDEAGLARGADVSVKLSALGQRIGWDGVRPERDAELMALEHATRICEAANSVGATVTVDMEEHGTVDSTLSVVAELRAGFPATGVAVQARLRRAEEQCRDLAVGKVRVRLVKGAYGAPTSVAYARGREADTSYVRCMRVLMAGDGYPMLATHDPRMIEIASALAVLNERDENSFEYQMLYGVRPGEQSRLVDLGARVRVYVPYGEDWYGYLLRRLAERPANLRPHLRSLVTAG